MRQGGEAEGPLTLEGRDIGRRDMGPPRADKIQKRKTKKRKRKDN